MLNSTIGWLLLETANVSNSLAAVTLNVSRLFCNTTKIVEYNFSNATCQVGTCNAYASTACPAGSAWKVHYFLNTSINPAKMGALEVLWQVPVGSLYLDSNETHVGALVANNMTTDTTNKTTVLLDGVLSEHIPENSTAGDYGYQDSVGTITNATRVRTQPGFCNSKLQNNFFAGVDKEPPLPIAADSTGDGLAGNGYTDFKGLGLKKSPEAFMYGMPTVDFNGSVICKGVPLGATTNLGQQTNTSKYYLYLDTDGSSTGGCSASDNSSLVGFEYFFMYTAEIDDTNRVAENFVSKQCNGGVWASSPITLKGEKNAACDFVGGPVIAIGRDSFTQRNNVNLSKKWRAYAASAALGGNSTNVTDRVGPGSGDFEGIDAEAVDCTSTADKDNSLCSTFKQFGFVPGEFGPACKDSKDNDADGSTDCSDLDCAYDPFFCDGSFTSRSGDESAPAFVWKKVNDKVTTGLTIIFGTNEPSNGTVKYYYNDSGCAVLNTTIYDAALNTTDTHDDYRQHHVVELGSLSANKTYYYKMESCDPTGNCAVSKCLNATTALNPSNITFKVELPVGWTLDIPSLNLSNFSGKYAIKAGSDQLFDFNCTINQSNSSFALSLNGLDIFEKQTLNMSRFMTGTGLLGIDANQYQSFKQRTGLEDAIVHIPTSSQAGELLHCDDDGENCKNVTSEVSCTFGSTGTDCKIPDAVGLGFSTYKARTTSSGSGAGGGGGSSSSDGGGGGGGGGGAGASKAVEPIATTSNFWDNAAVGLNTATFAKPNLALTAVDVELTKSVIGLRIGVSSYDAAPPTVREFTGSAYQYVSITKSTDDSAVASATLSFTVPNSWLETNKIDAATIRLYRYDDVSTWNALPTTYIGSDGVIATYKATTPGFSYFAIATESASPAAVASDAPMAGAPPVEAVVPVLPEYPAPVGETAARESGTPTVAVLWVVLVLVIIGIVAYTLHRRR